MEGVKRIGLSGGVEVGIYGLEEIFQEVQALRMDDNDLLKGELLKRVKVNTWVPKSREGEFAAALLETYKAFCERIGLEQGKAGEKKI